MVLVRLDQNELRGLDRVVEDHRLARAAPDRKPRFFESKNRGQS